MAKNVKACIKIEILFICIRLVGAMKVQDREKRYVVKKPDDLSFEAQVCTTQEAKAL